MLAFVIPHRACESASGVIKAAREMCASAGLPFKILSVTGNNPTKQRNLCIEKMKMETEYFYFLDNDTLLTKEALLEFKSLYETGEGFSVLGGPVLTPGSDSVLQKCIGFVFSLAYVVGRISSRYSAKGVLRETDDSELILCNLIVKSSAFKECGNFNEKLYPNEENEFIFRLKHAGHRIIYSPAFAVKRSQRESIRAFIKQMLSYGRGRGEQTKVSPQSFNPALLLPIFYPGLLLAFILLPLFFNQPLYYFYTLVLFLIPLLAFLQALKNGLKSSFYVPFLAFLAHLLYGVGFIFGCFSKGYLAEKKEFKCEITVVD